jgi:hypothetical protein
MHEVTLSIECTLKKVPATYFEGDGDLVKVAVGVRNVRFSVVPRPGDELVLDSSFKSRVSQVQHVFHSSTGELYHRVSLGSRSSCYYERDFERRVEGWREAGFDVTVTCQEDRAEADDTLPPSPRDRARELLDEITAKGNVHGRETLVVPDVEDAIDRIARMLRK